MTWKRHRDGDGSTAWTATIDGIHVIVINMQGQSVRYTGLGAHVEVFTNDRPDDPWSLDRREVWSDYTVGEAKAWAEKRYANGATMTEELRSLDLEQISRLDALPQRQDSLTDQLRDLHIIAVRIGCYDAADWLWKQGRLEEEA